MPKLGLTMQEGTIAEWKVSPARRFRARDILVVVETEKVAYEVEAEADGVLAEILAPVGETVPVGAAIARWEPADGAETARVPVVAAPVPKAAVPLAPPGGEPLRRVIATPLARRIAREHGIELSGLRGKGPSGRIRAADVEDARLSAKPEVPAVTKGARMAVGPTQAAMARRLAAVKREVPHFYLASEVEATPLLQAKESLNAEPGAAKVTINHMVVTAVGRVLLDFPWANRVWSQGGLVACGSPDVGIAVHSERGLFVPILRGAGNSTLPEVAAGSDRLVGKAREGKLDAGDMAGGCIAVSNAGMFHVTYLTPIINPGHSAILGVGSLRELFRPGRNGQPELRREIGLVLACDHRVFDGVAGLKILNRIIHYLGNPILLMRSHGK